MDDEEHDRISRLYTTSCWCHVNPPCSWCTELSEEEADIVWNGGRELLDLHWKLKLNNINQTDINSLIALKNL